MQMCLFNDQLKSIAKKSLHIPTQKGSDSVDLI